jgi:hypothetical protein
MSRNNSDRNNLFIFNLETDLDSLVLAAAHDWIEAFSAQYETVEVYSTHVGRSNLGENVKVSELGGGSLYFKFQNLLRLLRVTQRLWKFRRSAVVFHHMSSKTLAILGIPIRIMGIPQGIWYSHSKADLSLRMGKYFAQAIFTSTEYAVPLKDKKVSYLGHGIKISSDEADSRGVSSIGRKGIVSVGRIARVKHLEQILQEMNTIPGVEIPITFLGPVSDIIYASELSKLAAKFNLTLLLSGPRHHSEIPEALQVYKYIFSGTPFSVDKALLEGALSGCFVITSNVEAIKLSGMEQVWKRLNLSNSISISDQLKTLEAISPGLENDLRQILRLECRERNDLNETVKKIKAILGRV